MDIPHRYGSLIWNSIIKARDILKDGHTFRIGNGESSFWYAPWLGLEPLYNQVFSVDIHDVDLKIKDLFYDNKWNLERPYTCLQEITKHAISNKHLFLSDPVTDGFVWSGNVEGVYTAKKGYKWFISPSTNNNSTCNWQWI